MKHLIFSNTLTFESADPQVQVKNIDLAEIEKIQKEAGTDIYLCGGGVFAGWLLDHQKINILKLKLNPLILGQGIRIFGESTQKYGLVLLDTVPYENGLQIMTYRIDYENKI